MPEQKKYILILLFTLMLHNALSQTKIQFEHISLEDGLSQSSVSAILQDYKGFTWFATLDGLNKYNGYEMQAFRNNTDDPFSLPDNAINALFEDIDNNLWVGTRSHGIAKFDKIKNKFLTIENIDDRNNSLSSNNITCIFQDSRKNFWIGTDKGINILEYSNLNDFYYKDSITSSQYNFSFENYDSDSSANIFLTNNVITDIVEDKNGSFWIATEYGLNYLNIKNKTCEHFLTVAGKNSLPSNNIRDILLDNDSILWIATDNGLCRFNLTTKEFLNFQKKETGRNSLSSNDIKCILKDNNNWLWVGTTDAGISIYDEANDEYTRLMHDAADRTSLSTNSVLCLLNDNSNILWVGTSLGGVNKWIRSAEDFSVFRHNPYDAYSLSSNQVRCIFQDKRDVIWVGTVDGGLNQWYKEKNMFIRYKYHEGKMHSIPHAHVRSILEDSRGFFWIGTDGGGLCLFNRATGQFTKYIYNITKSNTITNNRIWKVFEDSKGNLWIGTFGGGLNRFDYDTKTFSAFQHNENDIWSITDNNVSTIYEDKNGTLWVGTYGGGLCKWTGEGNRFIPYLYNSTNPNSLGNNRVYVLFEDSKGNFWVGTKGSLNKFDRENETFERFDERDGFPNNVFMGILEDKEGNLWISTNGGISKFNPETGEVRNYNVKDGLQSNEFLVGSYWQSENGEMFFGGINGFNAFFPEKIKDNQHIPEIVITNFLIRNKTVQLDTAIMLKNRLELSYLDDVITLEFVALDYVFPEKNQYAYKMENLDEDWNYVGNRRFASYTNLEPGDYVFRVKGSNSDGVWNEIGTAIYIHIDPPFWKTKWFYALMIAAFFLLLYLFIWFREKKLRRTKEVLEIAVKVRTEEIQFQKDEIEQQRDEIAAQRDLAERQKGEIEKQNLKITDSIQYASRIQTALLPPDILLDNLFEEYFVYFRPRDIVSGDYYWTNKKDDKIIMVAADCTGHGVPGAFMSVLGISFLNEIVNTSHLDSAAEILNKMRDRVKQALRQTGKKGETKDGMDMALAIFDMKNKKIQFAGANNPLYIIRNEELIQYKPDRMPIGIFLKEKDSFTNHTIDVENNDLIYIFSDGYIDQFGGTDKRKFLSTNFKELLLKIHKKPLREQHDLIENNMKEWKGDYQQIDDMLVIGIKIKL